jgi:hypothetical protein
MMKSKKSADFGQRKILGRVQRSNDRKDRRNRH